MRVTWARILAAIILTAAAVTITAAPPAHARTNLTPSVQLCDTSDPAGLCMNRSQGGLSVGTPVISYQANDPNDDAGFIYLDQMCGGSGKVTLNCPYLGSNWNQLYHGNVLVALEAGQDHNVGASLCVGKDGTLSHCPDADGICHFADNCVATIFVAVGCTQLLACSTVTLLNRYWTAKNGTTSWAKIPIFERQLIVVGAQQPQQISELIG